MMTMKANKIVWKIYNYKEFKKIQDFIYEILYNIVSNMKFYCEILKMNLEHVKLYYF